MVVTIDSAANQSALGLMTTMINANSTNSSAPATIEFGANATGGLAPYSYNGISVMVPTAQTLVRRYLIHLTSLEITLLR